jgi:transcriptional regulator with XRE-family HTH domain
MKQIEDQVLTYALTTKRCKKVLEDILAKRGWSLARVARTIDVPPEYVRRIRLGQQSFQLSDVESLAQAFDQQAHELIFESIKREELAPRNRGLYDLVQQEVERHREFREVMSRKPVAKRRTRSKTKSVA